MRRFHRRWLCIACSAGFALALGCGSTPPGHPTPTHYGNPPSKEEISKRGQDQKFRTRLGAAARQILAADKGSTSEPVVVVQIDPDTGSYNLTAEQLDAGAVVGRFRKYSSGSLRRFGLGVKDTESYWYVYRDTEGYKGRFVSETMDTTYKIEVETHNDPKEEGLGEVIPWKQSIAQFEYLGPLGGDLRKSRGDGMASALVMEGGGGTVWMSCMPLGCCKIN